MRDDQEIKNLLLQISSSDEAAFRQLFYSYSDKVYSFARKMTRSQTLAEEMVQEVFLKVWMSRSTLTEIDNFPAFLFTIARNQTLNALKRAGLEARTRLQLLRNLEEKHNETEEKIIHQEYEHLLSKTIDQLPPQQRLVYSLCHQEGLRYEEVARRLNISKLTVKTHMQQALRAIKSQFAQIIQVIVLSMFSGF